MTDVPAAKLDFPAYVSESAQVSKVMNRLHNARIHLVQITVTIAHLPYKFTEKSSFHIFFVFFN